MIVAVVAVVGLAVLVAVPRLRGGGEVASEAATTAVAERRADRQPSATPRRRRHRRRVPRRPRRPRRPRARRRPSAGEAPPVTETATPAAPDQVDPAVLRSHVEALDAIAAANGGVRAAGTPGYDASVAWAHGVLEGMGLVVTEQPFEVQTFRQDAPTTVDLEGDADDWVDGRDLRALLFAGTGTGEGPIAIVDQGCSGAGFDGFPAGAVAVLAPGDCPPRELALNAWDAGAAGALIESSFLSDERCPAQPPAGPVRADGALGDRARGGGRGPARRGRRHGAARDADLLRRRGDTQRRGRPAGAARRAAGDAGRAPGLRGGRSRGQRQRLGCRCRPGGARAS